MGKIEKKEVKILHFPNEKMIVDYSSKRAQGSLFEFQRNTILGAVMEDFVLHKRWCEYSLKKCGLWHDEESGLHKL